MEKARKNITVSYKKKTWDTKKKRKTFPEPMEELRSQGKASNPKSGETQAPAGRKESQSQASAHLGQPLPSTT